MKLPDVNVLLFAANQGSDEHEAARTWLESAFEDQGGVAFAWIALLGFIRLATWRGIFARPLAIDEALSVVRTWLDEPSTRVLHPTERHAQVLGRLLIAAGAGGNLITDAHLAALAIEHGATLGSFDRDFERFSGLAFEAVKLKR
ncbi:MAG: PIN domain-containing protein [Betaproteobacteria bacterium]|nr:PIN domain-containing protein [Betaproteobacteria bacterium]